MPAPTDVTPTANELSQSQNIQNNIETLRNPANLQQQMQYQQKQQQQQQQPERGVDQQQRQNPYSNSTINNFMANSQMKFPFPYPLVNTTNSNVNSTAIPNVNTQQQFTSPNDSNNIFINGSSNNLISEEPKEQTTSTSHPHIISHRHTLSKLEKCPKSHLPYLTLILPSKTTLKKKAPNTFAKFLFAQDPHSENLVCQFHTKSKHASSTTCNMILKMGNNSIRRRTQARKCRDHLKMEHGIRVTPTNFLNYLDHDSDVFRRSYTDKVLAMIKPLVESFAVDYDLQRMKTMQAYRELAELFNLAGIPIEIFEHPLFMVWFKRWVSENELFTPTVQTLLPFGMVESVNKDADEDDNDNNQTHVTLEDTNAMSERDAQEDEEEDHSDDDDDDDDDDEEDEDEDAEEELINDNSL